MPVIFELVTQIKVLFCFCYFFFGFQCYFLPYVPKFISKIPLYFFFNWKLISLSVLIYVFAHLGCITYITVLDCCQSFMLLPSGWIYRVEGGGRGQRKGRVCVKEGKKKKQENHPVNSARSSEVSLRRWWVYWLPGVKRGCAYGSAVVLIRSSCLMWLENKRRNSWRIAEYYWPLNTS